jgi:cytochrome c oxidase subunit 5b
MFLVLPDPWDVLYGLERYEQAMLNEGYDDVYDSEPAQRKKVSTAQDPNIIQTLLKERVIACICEEDTHHLKFMNIQLGETKRCYCGHFFKCVERKLPDLSKYGVGVIHDSH